MTPTFSFADMPLSRQLALLDPAAECVFDRVLGLASALMGGARAGLLFHEGDRYWFRTGETTMSGTAVDRDGSFERYTIARGDVFFVSDAQADPRFQDHPRVAGPPFVRSYVGTPLVADDGSAVGALAVMGTDPAPVPTDVQRRLLRHLASDIMACVGGSVRRYQSAIGMATGHAIMKGRGEATITVGADGTILHFSNGYDGPFPRNDNPAGGDLLRLLRAEPESRLADAIQRGLRQRAISDFDEYYPPLDRLLTFAIFPFEPAGIVICCREASRASDAEAALRASEARLHRSQEHLARAQRLAGVGSAEIDLVTGECYWSDQIYRLFGYEPGAIKPSTATFQAAVHPEDRERVRDNRARIEAGEPVSSCEFRVVRPNGEVRTLFRVGEIARDEEGRPKRFLITMQDVTELRAAERQRDEFQNQLQHTQRLEALGTLAGGIAHDLNNTLVPVIALSKLLLNDKHGAGREELEVILRAGERARDLVTQVLAFSRRGPSLRQRVDLRAVVADSLKMLRASIDQRIRFHERLLPVPPVMADAGQIHQVVVNLVTNAAQSIGERPGTISIILMPASGSETVELTVGDDGPGMDEATRARIFEPFFTTKEIGGGTGLGLSIVHGIVTGHGGRIVSESRPGQGARFIVTLPTAERAAASMAAPTSDVENDQTSAGRPALAMALTNSNKRRRVAGSDTR